MPLLWGKPLIERLQTISPDDARENEALVLQIRTLLEAHFSKEKNALYPLTEKVVDDATLHRIGEEMEKRKSEVRPAIREKATALSS